jgi:hypothetical protein
MHLIEVTLPEGCAGAGCARRIAMEHAALLGRDGALLTSDADARLGPDWIAANLAALAAGADAVAGRAVTEPEGAKRIPAHLHAIDARECAYAALLDEMRALLEPDPADPWPRHDEESGASIAVTLAAYRRAGGMPAVPLAALAFRPGVMSPEGGSLPLSRGSRSPELECRPPGASAAAPLNTTFNWADCKPTAPSAAAP